MPPVIAKFVADDHYPAVVGGIAIGIWVMVKGICAALTRIIHEGADFSDSGGHRSGKPRCQAEHDEAEGCATRNLTRTASAASP